MAADRSIDRLLWISHACLRVACTVEVIKPTMVREFRDYQEVNMEIMYLFNCTQNIFEVESRVVTQRTKVGYACSNMF